MNLRCPKTPLCLAMSLALIIGPLTSICARAQSASNTSERPILVPNSKPYSSDGLKNATGRAGSANISVRALIGRDASTDVEVTTGAFDSAVPAPGTLTRVQLKTLNQNDEVVYVQNYNNLTEGGSFRRTLTDVRRGQPLQIQANVRGIDGNRTGVVTVLDNVKLRPDLKAQKFIVPETAAVNAPVNITVSVREMNNDVGATGDCVLYADDVAIDRAVGISVARGDTVNCAFAPRFISAGTKNLRVTIENVMPGDYDPANNSAVAALEVINPQTPVNYSASAYEGSWELIDRYDTFWSYSSGNYFEQSDYGYNNRETRSGIQRVNLNSWTNRAVPFPLNLSVTEIAANGTTLRAIQLSNVTPNSDQTWTYVDATGSYLYRTQHMSIISNSAVFDYFSEGPVSSGSPRYPGYAAFRYSRYEGRVIYVSSGYQRYWNNQGSSFSYFWNFSDNSGTAQPPSFGNQLRLETSFATVGGLNVYVANPVIGLTNYFFESPYIPYTCNQFSHSDTGTFYYERSCREYYYRESANYGSAHDGSQP